MVKTTFLLSFYTRPTEMKNSKRCPKCGHEDVDLMEGLRILLLIMLPTFGLGYSLGVIAAYVARGGM